MSRLKSDSPCWLVRIQYDHGQGTEKLEVEYHIRHDDEPGAVSLARLRFIENFCRLHGVRYLDHQSEACSHVIVW